MPRTISVEIVGDASSLERSFRKASTDAAKFDRSMGRTFRGVVAGSGAFRSLGRSVAFASASFLGGAGFVAAITSTVKAAEESQRVLGQTRVAVENSGESWVAYRKRIEDVSKATSQLSGFDDERLLATFSNLVRRTGDVNRALQLNALAANVARGRNISLEAASQLVLKASMGNVGALRRLGIAISKNATSYQAIDLLQRKYAGSAAAYGRTAAGAQDRFRVAVENLQEAVGTQLLPSIAKYLNKGADWLNQSRNQRRIADDVRQALGALRTAVDTVRGAFQVLNEVTGSTKSSLELLLAAFVAFKTAAVAQTIWNTAAAVTGIGAAAETSTKQVGLLRLAILRIAAAYLIVNQAAKQLGHPGMGLDFSDPTAADVTVTIGGRKYIKGSIAELEARQRQRLQRRFGIPAGPNLFGLGPPRTAGRAAAGAAGAGTAGGALTAAQLRAISLSGTPSLAAMRAEVAYDKRALAFLQKRFAAGKVSAKNYKDQVISLNNDLAQWQGQIQSILDAQARDAKKKSDDAAKRRKSALQKTADSARAYLQAISPGFRQFQQNQEEQRRAARAAAGQFRMPPGLELQQARAEALGLNIRPILLRMRAAAYQALHSGRLAIEAQTDAWNAIAGINEQLKKGADKAKRRQALQLAGASGAQYQFATARGGPTIHIEHFYSAASSPRALEEQLAKRARARAHVRRGAR